MASMRRFVHQILLPPSLVGDRQRGWELNLAKVIATPFWKYMDVEKVKEQDGKFRDWLIKQAG